MCQIPGNKNIRLVLTVVIRRLKLDILNPTLLVTIEGEDVTGTSGLMEDPVLGLTGFRTVADTEAAHGESSLITDIAVKVPFVLFHLPLVFLKPSVVVGSDKRCIITEGMNFNTCIFNKTHHSICSCRDLNSAMKLFMSLKSTSRSRSS